MDSERLPDEPVAGDEITVFALWSKEPPAAPGRISSRT